MFIWFQQKKRKSGGQIATIITLAIGVIFVLVVLTVAMNKATAKKTMLSNAADGAALLLASNLGSLGNKLSHEYVNGGVSACSWDILAIVAAAIMVASILIMVVFPETMFLSIMFRSVTFGLITSIGGAAGIAILPTAFLATWGVTLGKVIQWAYFDQQAYKNISLYYKTMTAEEALPEQAIYYAASMLIDDFTRVTDINDDNANGDKTDQIGAFIQFYSDRVRHMPNLGTIVSAFDTKLLETVTRETDPTTHQITDAYLADQVTDPATGKPVPSSPGRAFADWLKNDFIPYLTLLQSIGYDLTSTTDPTTQIWQAGGIEDGSSTENDEVDGLFNDIVDFENWSKGLLTQGQTSRIMAFTSWYEQFVNDDPNLSWEARMVKWHTVVQGWINRLEQIRVDAENCLNNSCTNHYWSDCCTTACGFGASAADGAACEWAPCNCVDVPVDADGDGVQDVDASGNPIFATECDSCDASNNPIIPKPSTCTPCVKKWVGCSSSGCCIENKGCAACSGACTKATCCNTCCKIEDPGHPGLTTIPQYEDHLKNFITLVSKLPAYVDTTIEPAYLSFEAQVDAKRKLIYSWTDPKGGAHTVKIVVDKLPRDANGHFKVPYVTGTRPWGFEKCIVLKDYEGEFRVFVSRYDNEAPVTATWRGLFNILNWNKTGKTVAWAHYGINKKDIYLEKKYDDTGI